MQTTACTNAALRILVACAARDGAAVTMPEMAAELGLTEALVVKACHLLMRAGHLKGVRGRGGGYRLGRPAAEISLLDVVRVFEDEADLFPCGLKADGPCRLAEVCRLREICAEAWGAYGARLAATSVASVAATPTASVS